MWHQANPLVESTEADSTKEPSHHHGDCIQGHILTQPFSTSDRGGKCNYQNTSIIIEHKTAHFE